MLVRLFEFVAVKIYKIENLKNALTSKFKEKL